MTRIVHYDIDHLNYVEKPSFFRDINSDLSEGELWCESVVRASDAELQRLRDHFDRWNVAFETYRVQESSHERD